MSRSKPSTRAEPVGGETQRRFVLLQAGLDHINQGFTVIDAELRMIAWNRRFFTLLDFPMGMAKVGTPFADFMRYNAVRGEYGPGEVEELVAERVRAAASFQPHYFERVRPNGTIIAVRGEPLPEQGFVTTYTDITEQRYYERLIQEQNQELDRRVRERTAALETANADLVHANQARERMAQALLHAQKMEAVGQLTGGLAHDFNNLLTIVLGNLTALAERHAAPDEIHEFVDPALQAARRGAGLIKRLLAFARQQPLEPSVIEVGKLIDDLIRLLRRSLPETIAIAFEAPAAPLHIRVDSNQLESALLNLALNARDAMPMGGRLRFAIETTHIDGDRAAPFEIPPGRYVTVQVQDTGTGMDDATLARVFEPFFTRKTFGSGSGLGLSMVYGFVRQSGGGVRIDSRPGGGTMVILALPVAEAGAETAEIPAAPPPPAATGDGKLVLLVEDEDDVRAVIRRQLTDLGYLVIEANNGDEAARLIDQVPDLSVLVSDVVMPGGMGGPALAEHARRRRPDLRVVLISGYALGLEDKTADATGAPLLRKPFAKDALAAVIEGGAP